MYVSAGVTPLRDVSTAVQPDNDANNDMDQDTHCCGKCRLVFTSLDAYIQHKLSKDNCKVTYTKSSRWLIPRIVVKKEKRVVPVDVAKDSNACKNQESSEACPPRKGTVAFFCLTKHYVVGRLFLKVVFCFE